MPGFAAIEAVKEEPVWTGDILDGRHAHLPFFNCALFGAGLLPQRTGRSILTRWPHSFAAPFFSSAGQLTITSSGCDPPTGFSTRNRLPSGTMV